ncbi:MAG: hypothetical protein IT585_08215, partial [candidate division Zixibacteria bacterium]|nr:hypothetical protein [candidate division Zixibacteria bacterium]
MNKEWQNEVNRRIEMSIRSISSIIALLAMMLVAFNGDAANSVLLSFSDLELLASPTNATLGSETQAVDNKYVISERGLPVFLLRLVVKGGEIDSVMADRWGVAEILKSQSAQKWDKIATFAGDVLRAEDFYENELKRLEGAAEQSAAAWIVDRGRWNGMEIVTVAVSPYDEIDE